jgi:5-methylcytosine-specific restriction protein A
MPNDKPNPFQKLVRGWLRDRINEVNQKTPKPLKITKISEPKSRSTIEEKPSRYIPLSMRVDVLNRDGYKCVFCGRNSKEVTLEIDHIIPFSGGGSNKSDNLQTLCFDCNRGKGARKLK